MDEDNYIIDTIDFLNNMSIFIDFLFLVFLIS